MPTLPDLQTTLISTLCYFDAGVVIKKSDILPILESFTEYDNGVDGIMSFTFDGTRVTTGARIKVQVRIRTDGMCYAWGLRADENKEGTQFDSANGTVNWQRALLPVSAYGGGTAQGDTLLFRAVQALVNAVTTAGKTVPTTSTVSYYDFEFTGTGNIYVFGSGNAVANNGNNTVNWQFTQPAGLTLFLLAARMAYSGTGGGIGSGTWTHTLNSTTIFTKVNPSSGVGGGVVWMARQGAALTTPLQPVGTQNNASLASAAGNGMSMSAFVTLVIYGTA